MYLSLTYINVSPNSYSSINDKRNVNTYMYVVYILASSCCCHARYKDFNWRTERSVQVHCLNQIIALLDMYCLELLPLSFLYNFEFSIQ